MLSARRAPGPTARFGYASPTPFVRDRLHFLRDLAQRYGDCCRFRLGFREVHFLNHPQAVRQLLAVEQRRLRRTAVTQLTRAVLGTSVFNAEGEAHREQRRRLGPMLHARGIAAHGPLMAGATHALQAGWRDGETIDAAGVARRLALEIGSRALFGVDLGAQSEIIGRSVRRLFATMNRVDHPLDWPGWLLPSPRNLGILHAAWRLRRIAVRTVAHARAERPRQHTLLGMLIEAHERGEVGLQLVRDEVSLLTVAGHETTAQALTWALYLIGRHPEIQCRMQAEIDALCGDVLPGPHSIEHARLLGHVIKETLRLFPPSPVFDRVTCTELDLGGCLIPAGRTVFVSPFVTQRDPRFFTDPDRFDPDRWNDAGDAAHSAWFPFGAGPRRCLGEAFASMEMKMVLAVLLQRWTLHFDGAASAEPEALVTLRPRQEIRLRLERRGGPGRAVA